MTKTKEESFYNLIKRTEMGSKVSPKLTNIPEYEAYENIKAIATYYPNHIKVYIPKSEFSILKKGLEMVGKNRTSTSSNENNDETNLERSLRRTRKAIKDYALCNDFELFATFTFANDRQNIERSKRKMANWLKNQSKRKGKFRYLVVPEFHKDGKSLHFHALLANYSGELKESRNANGRLIKKYGKQIFEIPSYTLGFNNIQKLNKNDRMKTAFYITKYISKDMPIFSGRNRYWVSKNLKKPVREYNPDTWYKHIKPNRKYEIDFGVIAEYDRGSHPLIDMLGERFNQQ